MVAIAANPFSIGRGPPGPGRGDFGSGRAADGAAGAHDVAEPADAPGGHAVAGPGGGAERAVSGINAGWTREVRAGGGEPASLAGLAVFGA